MRHTEIPVLFLATLSQQIFNMRNLNQYEMSINYITNSSSLYNG